MLVKSRNIFACLLFFSTTVQAEQGCPDGLYPGGAAPGQICIPMSGYGISGNGVSTPQVVESRWMTRWGALALDVTSAGGSKLGRAEGLSSKRKAEKAALADCRTRGGQNCVVAHAYYDQCVAVAWGDTRPAIVSAVNSEVASRMALEKCNGSDANCDMYYTGCSYPERAQ
jgi:hypothetical protein